MMRSTLLLVAAATALSACAMNGREPATNTYAADLAEIRANCDARGGVLVPTGEGQGRAALEYGCRITEASRIRSPG